MRLFVAINLGPEALQPLERAQQELEKRAPGVYGWTDLSKVHLTLYFLGEMDETGLEAAIQRLESVQLEPFELAWGGLVVLPSQDVPKILAAGVVGDESRLRALQRQVHDLVFPIAENKETRAFFPHATFGRLKRGVPPSAKVVKRALAGFQLAQGTRERVVGFDLVRSESGPGGSQHSVVRRFPLGVGS